MQESSVFHEDVFYEYFRPFRHSSAYFDIWGGHGLETFGKDLQLVREYDENYVWTVIDGSEGSDQWIIPGYHHINRICYLLTEVAHDWATLDFVLRVVRIPSPLWALRCALAHSNESCLQTKPLVCNNIM